MTKLPQPISEIQQPTTSILPAGMDRATGLLLPPRRAADRLSHLDDEVYDLSAESHLVRFLKVLLGDVGAGGARKRMVMSRFSTTYHGMHFLELDRFWGALFGAERATEEVLDLDPYEDTATADDWIIAHAKDSQYRSRLEQLARAFNYGATTIGIELASEALLNIDVDVYEVWRYLDNSTVVPVAGHTNTRKEFVIRPKRDITQVERWLLTRVLDRLRPADAIMNIEPEGLGSYVEIPLRGVSADSEYWEIATKVISRNVGLYQPYGSESGVVEKERFAFSGYQSEAWSYNGDTSAVLSYSSESQESNFERVVFRKGDHLDYTPGKALLTPDELLSGRMVSDGILLVNPMNRQGNETQVQKRGGITVDRVNIDDLNRVLDDGRTNIRQSVRLPSQQFWSTTERKQGNDTIEYLELRYAEARTINHISFDVSKFPHHVWVEIFDEDTDGWVRLMERTVKVSSPGRFIKQFPSANYQHPMHLGPDHWEHVSDRIPVVRATRLRVGLQRGPGKPPHNKKGPIPYPLAIRDLDVGYRITSPSDLPSSNIDVNDRDIASTIDVLGSRIKFALHRRRANGLLRDPQKPWKCEPQPSRDAVVNFYADVRDPEGNPQTVGRMLIEPLVDGPTFSLYSSNDLPGGDFDAVSEPLTDHITDFGEVTRNAYATDFDSSAPAFTDVEVFPLQFTTEKSWWVSLQLQPHQASDDPDEHPVVAFGMSPVGAIRDDSLLYLSQDTVTFVTQDGLVLTTPLSFPVKAEVELAVAYVAEDTDERPRGLYLYAEVGETGVSEVAAISLPQGYPVARPQYIRFGGSFDDPGLVGSFLLRSVVLKEGVLDPDEFDTFARNPIGYVTKPTYPSDGPDRTGNSILRYAPGFTTTKHTSGFVGGAGDKYEDMDWYPIARDYVLRKGIVTLPPTAGRFFKFEFSNLVPEMHEQFLTTERPAKFFPAENRISFFDREASLDVMDTMSGFATLETLNRRYRDGIGVLVFDVGIENPNPIDGPTTAMYAVDPEAQERLRQHSWIYGFTPWNLSRRQPMFTESAKHTYEVRNINNRTRVAYTVGLKALTMYAMDYTVGEDNEVYYERFDDLRQVEINTWTYRPGSLRTGGSAYATAESKVFRSISPIEAVQFAAQQTPPIQLVRDHDFRDLDNLVDYKWDDPLRVHLYGDADAFYRVDDHTVKVARQVVQHPYGAMDGTPYGDDGDTPGPADDLEDFTYGELEAISTKVDTIGGLETHILIPSPSGRVHAATRVVAETDIENPIYLQILDDQDRLLAEEPRTMLAGETAEWSIGYTIGSLVEINDFTYGDHEARTYNDLDFMGRWIDVEQERVPYTSDYLKVRLIQRGPSTDSWRTDVLSTFDDAITWEFSNDAGLTWFRAEDIKNNPDGALRFPTLGNELMWRARGFRPGVSISSVQVRPWYVGRPVDRTFQVTSERGPNLSPWDDYTPIAYDPEFRQWHDPVPQQWFAAFRGRGSESEYEADTYVPPRDLIGTDVFAFYGYADIE